MIRFCPTCNRSSDEVGFIGEFCEVCTADRIGKTLPNAVSIKRCKNCMNIKTDIDYEPLNKDSIERAIKHEMHAKEFRLKMLDYDEKKGTADILFKTDIDGNKLSFTKKLNIKIEMGYCPKCYRMKAGYYEAVVQLRGRSADVENFVTKLLKFIESRNGFVSKIDDMPDGCDIYASDKGAVSAFFDSKDNLKPKKSYELYGMRRGKKLYRHKFFIDLRDPRGLWSRKKR